MKILFESQDPVLISCVRSALEEQEMMSFIFDENISMVEGSIGAFQKRVMVIEDDFDDAHAIYLNIVGNYK